MTWSGVGDGPGEADGGDAAKVIAAVLKEATTTNQLPELVAATMLRGIAIALAAG